MALRTSLSPLRSPSVASRLAGRREILAMDKKAPDNQLIVDLTIHYQGKVYSLTLGRLVRWLVPLVIVVYRLVQHARDQAS